MKTIKSDLEEVNGFPGLVIKQESFDEDRETEIRIVTINDESTFQLVMSRYNNNADRKKELICINLDRNTTVQLHNVIGNTLNLQ